MKVERVVRSVLARRLAVLGAAGLAALGTAASCTGSPGVAEELAIRGNPDAPVSSYPLVRGGTWVRGANLVDSAGRPQARQEVEPGPGLRRRALRHR
jgi:hypothetical protein